MVYNIILHDVILMVKQNVIKLGLCEQYPISFNLGFFRVLNKHD